MNPCLDVWKYTASVAKLIAAQSAAINKFEAPGGAAVVCFSRWLLGSPCCSFPRFLDRFTRVLAPGKGAFKVFTGL